MKAIVLAAHASGIDGIMERLHFYFQKKKYECVLISHPLHPSSALPSVVQYKEKNTFKIFPPLQYFFEGITAFALYRRFKKRPSSFDIAICVDPLSFLHIYLLRKFFHVQKIIYCNVDFHENRFRDNRMMNYIYNSIDHFAYRRCDYFFYLTYNYILKRDPHHLFASKAFPFKQFIDTSSIHLELPKRKNTFVYCGNLGYSVDFEALFIALARLKQEGIPFLFDIYGKGAALPEKIARKMKELHLENTIVFKGLVNFDDLLQKILPTYQFGVSPYFTKRTKDSPGHIFEGTDFTSKQVEYIAAGLPLITTRLNPSLDIIQERRFGFLAETPEEWYRAVKTLLTNTLLYDEYRKNSLRYAQSYDMHSVLDPIFDRVLANQQ